MQRHFSNWTERFDNVVDSGLFHVFSDEDRKSYVAGPATILKQGRRLFLMCFSDDEPGTDGPRRVSQQELRDAFAKDVRSNRSNRHDSKRGRSQRHDIRQFVAEFAGHHNILCDPVDGAGHVFPGPT